MEELIRKEFKEFLKEVRMPADGRIVHQGRRLAVKDLVSVVEMLKYSAENMSKATVGVVLTRIGSLIASKEIEQLKQTGQGLVDACLRSLSIKGWGLFIPNADKNGGDVILKNSAIAQEYPTKGTKVDYIAIGIISTTYERAFGRKFMVREVECIASGNEACRFTLKAL